jgi:hypothetical protein
MIEENPQRMVTTQPTRALVVLPFFLSILLTACYPPMKAPLRVKPVEGTGEDLRAEPDTNVIHPGVTTQAEIVSQFAAFDTGWKGERLFLGRWLYSGMVGNGGRWWAGKMLAVEFDEKRVVTRYRVLSDNDFLRDEDSWPLAPANNEPGEQQTDPSVTVKTVNVAGKNVLLLRIYGNHGKMSPNSLENSDYRIAAENIEGISRWPYATVYAPGTTAARDVGLVIHLKGKIYPDGDVQKKHGVMRINLETDVPRVVLLMRFLHMSGDNRPKS